MPCNGGMTLAGFLIAGPVAHSHALWRNPDHDVPFLSLQYYVYIARILECGKFDLIFFADVASFKIAFIVWGCIRFRASPLH
jgi:hypothetical protein